MSAILGRIEFSGKPVDPAVFSTALGSIDFYGKDATWAETDGSVALGLNFKKISRDEVAPTGSERIGATSIVADAILDNRSDIIRDLGLSEQDAAQLTSSALILRAYLKWGPTCTEHLLGDYAFAVYDHEKKQLYLARDHIGARPLYWAQRGSCFMFSSDMRGIAAFSDMEWQISDASVARYLVRPDVPRIECFYDGMKIVQPGHFIVADANKVTPSRWWDPINAPKIRFKTREDYVAKCREILEAAVNARIDTDLKVGSHISGGVDSTTIAVLASRELNARGQKLEGTYAWAPEVSEQFPDMGPGDERRLIQAVCERENFPVRYGTTSIADLMSYLARPFENEGNADLLSEIPLLELATKDGVGVMLSGWGGDEAYSAHGVGYISHLLKRGRWIKAIQTTRAIHNGRRRPSVIARGLWYNGIIPMLPGKLYEKFDPFKNLYTHQCFMNPNQKHLVQDEVEGRRRDIRLMSDPRLYLRQLLLLGHIGERMATWTAWGAEYDMIYRYPLTDRRLLDFMLGIPRDLLFGDGASRFFARAAAKDILPERTKKHDPANEKFRSENRLASWRELAKKLDAGEFDESTDWLDMDALRKSIANVPESAESNEILLLAEISAALRIWHMAKRHK